ncbi:MAG: FAD-binding protein [Clostridia bacterium]|nr:FAD-binding protein [Clostridia bacterium]
MAYLKINHERITEEFAEELKKLCPFGAIEIGQDGKLNINSACRTCRLCVRRGPEGCIEYVEEETGGADLSQWHGTAVYIEHVGKQIMPVSFELLTKAKSFGGKVIALFISDTTEGIEELKKSDADEIHAYIAPDLKYFTVLPYAAVVEDFIKKTKPAAFMFGATSLGRSLAPRVAARFHTGMTADCTMLEMHEGETLVQIRPAFGGNIMARILTKRNRPQFCTVREKVFTADPPHESDHAELFMEEVPELPAASTVCGMEHKVPVENIANAERIIAVGRGLKKKEDIALLEDLAASIGAQIACTRPLVEQGWMPAYRQIGLSGRTVKPKLIIAFGISGAIQFVTGMKSSDLIVAVNSDPEAPIFETAHVGICADLYDIVPLLKEQFLEG